MERITAYRWRGQIFETKHEAEKAIDEALGAIITKHSHAVAAIGKYAATAEYLESHLADFHEAYLLQQDKTVLTDDDD